MRGELGKRKYYIQFTTGIHSRKDRLCTIGRLGLNPEKKHGIAFMKEGHTKITKEVTPANFEIKFVKYSIINYFHGSFESEIYEGESF